MTFAKLRRIGWERGLVDPIVGPDRTRTGRKARAVVMSLVRQMEARLTAFQYSETTAWTENPAFGSFTTHFIRKISGQLRRGQVARRSLAKPSEGYVWLRRDRDHAVVVEYEIDREVAHLSLALTGPQVCSKDVCPAGEAGRVMGAGDRFGAAA